MYTDDRDNAPRESVWEAIAGQLARSIASGEHPAGSRLPTEHALAGRFGVNRHTVRRALSSLASQGLVRMVQGSGTYVEEFAMDMVLSRRTRHSQSLGLAGVPGQLRLLSARTERAVADVARALDLPARARVLRLEVLGEANGRPLHVSQRWFPLPRFDGLDALVRETGSITQAFAARGVTDYLRRESRIAAVLPEAEVAAALMQPAARPVIQVHSVNVDPAGVPVEHAVTWFAGDRVTLVVKPNE